MGYARHKVLRGFLTQTLCAFIPPPQKTFYPVCGCLKPLNACSEVLCGAGMHSLTRRDYSSFPEAEEMGSQLWGRAGCCGAVQAPGAVFLQPDTTLICRTGIWLWVARKGEFQETWYPCNEILKVNGE